MLISKLPQLIFFLAIFSTQAEKINTKINKQYLESKKTFRGNMVPENYLKSRNEILKILQKQIPDNESIFINYYQFGSTCIDYGFSEEKQSALIDKGTEIYSKLAKELHASDFYVYSADYHNAKELQKRKIYFR